MAKLRFAVIGASGMARAHMRGIAGNPDTELAAVCDIDLEKAKTAAAEFGAPEVIADYRALLSRPDIGAVVVVTPDQLHAEMTVAALEAGKHVLCEKPMAMTVAECEAMIAAERRSGKKLMVGQICRYTPGFILARECVQRGDIGELFFVESEYAHDYAHITGAGNWRLDPVRLRQPFLGGGCHAVDLLRWIAGNPYEITAYANHKMLPGWPVDDCTIAIMRFPNDVIGKAFVSIGCKRTYTMRSVFYGSKGTVICDNTSPEITLMQENGEGKMDTRQLPVNLNNHNAAAEIAEFADIILHDKPVVTSSVEGAGTVAACLAAVESAAKGGPVQVAYPQ